MIDKINGNEVYYENKKQRNRHALQAYENTPGAKTAEKKTVKAPAVHTKAAVLDADRGKSPGVILDLSDKAVQTEKKQTETPAWLQKLKGFLASAVKWIKNFWESGTAAEKAEGPAESDVLGELPPLDAGEEPADYAAMLNQAVHSGSLRQIERALTQDGAKHLAHNSDLLTYYDRRGNLVEMDDTEKHRVLFGDKNILKL